MSRMLLRTSTPAAFSRSFLHTNTLFIASPAASAFARMPPREKQALVPPTTAAVQTHQAFLQSIGRNCESVSEKFSSWEHLFTANSVQMDGLGIKPAMRKYILGCREWFKRYGEIRACEIPERRKKHIKRKEAVKLNRLKKLGLA
ncbi:hypothetical protein HDU91_001431 [Kappamyces sp. JEL0680]|nr:hypothetical protein HDU91_001431 [Kappamyces sp. JEL0680]